MRKYDIIVFPLLLFYIHECRLMWFAGIFAAISSIIYPAISALVSKNASSEQQGVALGILTGMRGLCNGLGPAIFGFLFWLFHVNLGDAVGVSKGTIGMSPGHITVGNSSTMLPVETVGTVIVYVLKHVISFLLH